MNESGTVVSAYTLYRHLEQNCSHPSKMQSDFTHIFLLTISRCTLYYTPAKQMFSGIYWYQPVCPSVFPYELTFSESK